MMKTLPQMAEIVAASGDDGRANYIDAVGRSSDLLRFLPFLDVVGGAYVYVQEGLLPGVAFEGDPILPGAGIVNPRIEGLKVLCGDLEVDPGLLKTHGPGVRRLSETMKARALGAYLTNAIINGDPLSSEVPSGLKHRIIQEQHKHLDGGSLTREALDDAIDRVDGATHLLVGTTLRDWLSSSGWLTDGLDEEGLRALFYSYPSRDGVIRLPVLNVSADPHGAPIIGYDEPDNTTSLYVVNLSDTGVCGLQNDMPDYADLGAHLVIRKRISGCGMR